MDLYEDLVATPCGQPALPSEVPPPPAQFSYQALPESGWDLGYAKLEDVFNYLRRGTNLVIPPEWKDLIPKPTN